MDKTDDFLGIFFLLYYTLILTRRYVNPNVSVGIFTAISSLQSKFHIPLRPSSYDKVKIFNHVLFSATTYYVDATNGNDRNNGLSPSTPWKTIAKVNASRFQPGNQILIKRGEGGSKVKPISFN
jgi:hypothetical protein